MGGRKAAAAAVRKALPQGRYALDHGQQRRARRRQRLPGVGRGVLAYLVGRSLLRPPAAPGQRPGGAGAGLPRQLLRRRRSPAMGRAHGLCACAWRGRCHTQAAAAAAATAAAEQGRCNGRGRSAGAERPHRRRRKCRGEAEQSGGAAARRRSLPGLGCGGGRRRRLV
jgi:hypothetical protein